MFETKNSGFETVDMELEAIKNISNVGFEIGSIYFKAVGLGPEGNPIWKYKKTHQGNFSQLLDFFLKKINPYDIPVGIASHTMSQNSGNLIDPIICLHRAAQTCFPEVQNIIEVGASHLILIRLNKKGQIVSINTNSLCAAGTGSFLDAQAARMGIEYKDIGEPNPDVIPPSIATRCAVFAKTDLIHRQQEGYGTDLMWSGLCRGMVDGLLFTLTKGKPLSGPTLLCGGVAQNKTFVWWFNNRIKENGNHLTLQVMTDPEYTVALGAAVLASERGKGNKTTQRVCEPVENRKKRPPLHLVRSTYPETDLFSFDKDSDGNEISLHFLPEGANGVLDVFLGLDIGSTSTKLTLIDAQDRIVLDVYRCTDSDPIGATKKLFNAVLNISEKHNIQFNVQGASTTGSGRKLIGKIIGADWVVNEITAHVTGTIKVDPTVETIFEIGGQDAKYMSVRNGHIVDANMNYVCAAGTGSFVEELATKLGYPIEEIGERVLGVEPPYTSSRCTVFMEQDIFGLLRRGIPRSEAAGAVMYSVIENYLERVVGTRTVSKKSVFFQGATARNRGLVAAIENVLGVTVVVSPYCHVMGAFGAALLAKGKLKKGQSKFRGLDLGARKITVKNEKCELCTNQCALSRAFIEGEAEKPVWGMKCGRDENESKKRNPDEYRVFQKRITMATKNPSIGKSKGLKPVIAIPRALSTYSLFSFWHSFFDKMGMEVRLSRPTDNVCIQSGNEYAGAELCLPVKSAYGHVMDLLKNNKTDAMFIPHMIADYRVPGLTQTRYCPYVEAMPSLIKSALKNRELDIRSIVSPVINFRLSHQKNAEALVEAFRPIISLTTKEVKRALIHAHKRRKVFENRLKEMGQVSMEKIKKSNKPGIVIIGRPYNTLDKGINQDIPYYIADCGVEVIPMDCLPLDYAPLTGDFKNLFWAYGQRIISSLVQVARTRGLYAVYLSNFSCGPDSFLLTYAESIMGTKPFLVLELDEHGSSGGYQTRLEAFMDVVLSDWKNNGDLTEKWDPPKESFNIEHLKDRTLWLPPMHPVGNRLFAAAIRREGFDAQPLSIEDDSSFALGKQWTRGSECLPAALTLGSFLKHLEMKGKNGIAPDEDCALFMPTSDGPCRLGQYRTLDRMVLDRLGHKKIPILSPTGENAYADFSSQLHKRLFKSMVASDILFKMRCRIRPYEVHRGDTAEVLEKWISKCEITIEKGDMNWEFFLESAMNDFLRIPVEERPCPLVGVVGEIYVRCNAYANSQVIETIEDLGGEAWLAPVSEWILYTSWIERYRSRCNGRGLWNSFKLYAKWNYMSRTEHQLYKPVKKLLHNRMEPSMEDILHEADHLLPVAFEGESILTLGRAILFGKRGADLVVNCAPFGCMHGNITTSIFEQMRETIGIPVVNTFYDGGTDNSLLGAFIHEAGQRKKDR